MYVVKNKAQRLIVPLLVASILGGGAAHAGSVAGFGGSTEVTQILNNVELVNQSAQMYQQVQNTITQIQHSQQQLKNLIAAPQMVWGDVQADLQALTQLVGQGQALGYALGNIDQQFATKYPGYKSQNYQQASRNWVQTSLDSLSAALRSAGLQSNQFANEQAAMANIQNIAAGSPGALQAAQAGVMVAGQQVQQLQKLRQLFMAQMQAQNSFMAGQAQNQADHVDAAQTFMKQGNGTVRQAGSSGFQSF